MQKTENYYLGKKERNFTYLCFLQPFNTVFATVFVEFFSLLLISKAEIKFTIGRQVRYFPNIIYAYNMYYIFLNIFNTNYIYKPKFIVKQ